MALWLVWFFDDHRCPCQDLRNVVLVSGLVGGKGCYWREIARDVEYIKLIKTIRRAAADGSED